MKRFWRAIISSAVLATSVSAGRGQIIDDGAQLAFEDMMIDDAIAGDLPELENDLDFFDDLIDLSDDLQLPPEDQDALAPSPPPALDEDALLNMLTDWDEDADSPGDEGPAWAGEFDATPQPAAEANDDMLEALGLVDDPDVQPAEPTVPAERFVDHEGALDTLAEEPVFEDVDVAALESMLDSDDVAPVAPAPDKMAEPPPEPVAEPIVEAVPEPEPEPEVAVEPPPPYEDPLTLDDAFVESLVRDTKTRLDEEQLEGFDVRRSHDIGSGPVERTGWLDRLRGR